MTSDQALKIWNTGELLLTGALRLLIIVSVVATGLAVIIGLP